MLTDDLVLSSTVPHGASFRTGTLTTTHRCAFHFPAANFDSALHNRYSSLSQNIYTSNSVDEIDYLIRRRPCQNSFYFFY